MLGWRTILQLIATSDVFGRDWRQVESDLLGRLPQQCKERYRLAATVAQLTFVFLRVHAHRCLGYRNTASMAATAKLIYHCVSKGSDTAYASPPS